jgi:hypothetical protein
MQSHIYLAKESDELVSHCRCETALITYPPQANCPWCGCGWLFTCQACRKAFTFAKGIETDVSWEALAQADLRGRFRKDPTELQVERWVQRMQILVAEVEPGRTYVALDGSFIPTFATGVRFDGWYAHHDLDCLPQTAALKDRFILRQTVSSKEYWLENRLPGKDAE